MHNAMINLKQFLVVFTIIAIGRNTYAEPKDLDIMVKGGKLASLFEYPEVVVVELAKNNAPQKFCSGVLIASDVVLSAGHCVQDGYQPVRATSTLNINLTIRSSENYARQPATGIPKVQSIKVLSFIAMDPTSIEQGKKLKGRDLLILKLSAKFEGPAISIPIANLNGIDRAKTIRFVGFGLDGQGSHGHKLYADVDIVAPRCRSGALGEEAGCREDVELYAKTSNGEFDACRGDSGGPAYIRNIDGRYRLVGITSRASSPSQQCGGGTFVTLLDGNRLEWIRKHVEVKLTPEPLHPMSPPIPACPPSECPTK
nr:trypsin-like serine protease [[Pseudomonas] sp. BICA1-14]